MIYKFNNPFSIKLSNPFTNFFGGFITIAVGIGLLIVGNYFRAQTQAFIANAERANGKVVEVVAETKIGSDGTRQVYYYPIIEFTTADGKTLRVKSPTGANPPAHRVGDRVPILYDPQTPEYFQEDTFLGLWLPTYMFLGAGAFFIFLGLLAVLNGLLWMIGIAGLLGVGAWLLLRRKRSAAR